MREIENIWKMQHFFAILKINNKRSFKKIGEGCYWRIVDFLKILNRLNNSQQGDQTDSIFIIAEGKVLFRRWILVRILSKGEYFGQYGLLQDNCVRGLTVKAIEESRLLALGKETLTKILGDGVQMIIYKNQYKWILQQLKINLIIQIDKFLDLLTIRKLKKGDIIINKGQQYGELIIVIDGK